MASVSEFVFDQAAFNQFINNPAGGVAAELEVQGQRVVAAAREYVGIQWPGGVSPPPQPHRRTGDLQASIRTTPPQVVGGVIQVDVIADSSHKGVVYPFLLRAQGYRFVELSSI